MLVVIVTWRERGGLETKAYGPWTAQADGSHLAEIGEFLRDFPGGLNREIVGATLHVVTPPGEAT